MAWVDRVQNRNRWRALVNTVMNHRVPYNEGNFLSANRLASQAGFYSIFNHSFVR